MYQTKLLDSYKSVKNYIQDKQIAADLGVAKSRISEMRSGKRYMSDIQAIYLAKECNIDEKEALIGVHADRTQNAEIKSIWNEIAKKLNSQGFQTFSIGLVALVGSVNTDYQSIAQCALCKVW
ncbi:DUF3693 domain-containing protein [Photobacterium swingsii]|uniref:DUF3693 domain-containing protein n=1 Tax=Photobacterium swingsii TaxID=680026 RepID=UPI003D0C6D7D